jgi:hypothetical protein
MSEREELEGLIDEVRPSVAALLSCHPVDEEGNMVSVPSHLIHDVVGSFAFIRRALSRLPKGNGELVEAVRDRELIEIFAAKSQEIDQSDENGRALALSYINAVQCLRSLTEGEG